MFDNLYFHLVRKIDSKTRLFLPAETGAEVGTSIVVVNAFERIYDLYLLDKINALVSDLRGRILSTSDIATKQMLTNELESLYGCAIKIGALDSQKRIVLPPQMDVYRQKEVHLVGRYDHIRIYPEEKDYEEAVTRSKKNNLFR